MIYSGYPRKVAPPLPPPESLPFPGNLIRLCGDCGLSANCKAPVPGDNIAPCEVLLVGQNPGCFPAGTYVSTPDGVRDIRDFAVGDSVLGSEGQCQRVLSVFQRTADDLAYIKVKSQPEIAVTPNHPIRVIRTVPCYDGHTRDYCLPCCRPSCGKRAYDKYAFEWITASDIHSGDYVVLPDLPASNYRSDSVTVIPFPQRGDFRKVSFRSQGRRKGFPLRGKLASVLGWYMAEGGSSVKNGTVGFNLGEGDGGYRYELERNCQDLFGLATRWVVRDKSYRLMLCSRPLAAWFIDLFGGNQKVRRIPKCIFHSKPSIIKSFIRSWYFGDGKHKTSGKNDGIVTASREAAYGLHSLFLRLGICATVQQEPWKSRGRKLPGGYFVTFHPGDLNWKRNRNSVTFRGQKLLRVDSIRHERANCTVYNIETEDNTYAVPFVVHNSQETDWGYKPFVGQAGRYLDSLLFQASIPRSSVAITNLVHCKTPNNRTPSPVEIQACSHWLDVEVGIVQPRIVVAMGAPAIAHFLGNNAGTVEHLHGKPVEVSGRIILPCYHPAAALRDTAKLRQCQEDFQVLRGLVKGTDWSEYHVVDEFPEPDYRIADTPTRLKSMQDEIRDAGEFAVDTEQCHGKLWSMQISTRPGTAWFVPIDPNFRGRVDLAQYNALAILHNYLYDIQFVSVPDDKFVDTMVMAYLLHREQGLKELASRLCGLKMKTYGEMVKPGQQKLSLAYLRSAAKREWSDPPEITETRWDNKKGEIVTRIKKPWHISRKISKALDDYGLDVDTDLRDRWRGIPSEERSVVESVMGPMPESSLADIPFDQALAYSARDADATIRVFHKLKNLIEDLDLDFVLNVDLGILPMVRDMMRNGMAVDIEHYKKLSEDYDIRMRVKAAELAGTVGHAFNPASSPQVAVVMYQELGFKPTKMTKSGDISTDDQELKKTGHPVAKGIIQYRGLLKLKSTYADNIIRSAHPDENGVPRMHTVLKTTRVETGRLSSSKDDNGEGANLQNIPTRNKESKQIKNGFIAPPGKILGEGDYCLVPGTRILTADYRWVPVESLHTEDNLIGITEDCVVGTSGANYKRVYTPTTVVKVGSRIAACWQVLLADGTSLTCSGEHPWLTREPTAGGKILQSNGKKTHSHSWGWVKTSDLVAGRQLSRLVQPWDSKDSWEKGYLAGVFDGKAPRTIPIEVLSVREVGMMRVISLQTSSHTFVAEGFFTHNSQVEMVTLAHLSNCARLIELFNRGGDPHTEMAARIFDVALDEAAKNKYRYPVKRLNFGIAYLIGELGLANQIQEYIADLEMEGEPVDIAPWDVETCAKFIAEWYRLSPEVKDYQLERAAEARRYGYVKDLFGRIRYIPEITCPVRSIQEAGARQAANFPVTASAQEIIKRAMGRLWQYLPQTQWAEHVKFLVQIHDSLIVEVTNDKAIYQPFFQWMGKVMTTVVKLRVPVKVDFKVGMKWGELAKIDLNGVRE